MLVGKGGGVVGMNVDWVTGVGVRVGVGEGAGPHAVSRVERSNKLVIGRNFSMGYHLPDRINYSRRQANRQKQTDAFFNFIAPCTRWNKGERSLWLGDDA